MEEWLKAAYERDRAEKKKFLQENPDFEPDGEFWDSHSCSAFADASGECQWCGALVYGSMVYCEAYGCDPPESYESDRGYHGRRVPVRY